MKLRTETYDAQSVRDVRDYEVLNVRPGDVVLDLGGNIGAFGRVAVDAGALVVALEPEPDNADLYRENVPEAEVYEAAVAAEEGHAPLWLGRSTASYSLDARRGRNYYVTVRTVTLPQLVREFKPTVIKADIEGAEYQLDWSQLDGVRALAIEFHFTPKRTWREQAPAVAAVIEAQGFKQVRPFKRSAKSWDETVVWQRA